MVVQHNITAMNANRYFGINNKKLSKSLEKLSSGYAINRAGDNAAGLAVSEKMRSQIAGMTQAVKNAQDGISMVQTYEGALTETDSILQRMKTLASQMANGGYDDPVDRTAAQQEFYQLNDELNQIADTDYNGVVVLNGGVMADGLKAVDGMFDYSNKAAQVAEEQAKALADAQATAQEAIDSAQKNYEIALDRYSSITGRDRCLNGNAVGWNSLDNSQYTQEAADDLFGIQIGATTADTLAAAGIESLDVDYTYDETNGWEITGGRYTDANGEVQELDKDKITDVIDKVTKTDNGGFIAGKDAAAPTQGSSANAVYGNAVFDGSEIEDGDVVTLTYTNTASTSAAPTNIGIDQDSLKNDVDNSVPTLTLSDEVTSGDISEEMMAALKKLNEAEIEFVYTSDGITPSISDPDLMIKSGDNAGEFKITYKDAKGKDVELATVTTVEAHGETADPKLSGALDTGRNAGETATFEFKGGQWVDSDGATVVAGSTLGAGQLGATVAGLVNGVTNANEGDKITVTSQGNGAGGAGTNVDITFEAAEATQGTIKFGVALDNGKYDPSSMKPTITPGRSKDGVDSTAVDEAFAKAKEALAAAKAAYPQSYDDLADEYKVSQSDAFNNSEAQMTYKDHLILQVGARTKDAVDFTFAYDSDAIGDLAADLNCTAKGLGTDILDIKTQESANYAIDKIDQAINKVSLVRGTFGAIQNRLDHKIDNLNVTVENLTDAESRIRDTNMAEEMMNFTKNQILSQASQSMLAQANQLPQSVLQLLQ